MLKTIRSKPLIGFLFGACAGGVVMGIGLLLTARQPLDPARLADCNIQELIDALPDEAAGELGTPTSVWSDPFAETEDAKGRRSRTESKPVVSPVMRELANRGVAALPSLLEHLDDRRATAFFVRPPADWAARWMRHADEYDPRSRVPAESPANVNTGQEQRIEGRAYRLCVGDLCYVVVGQIVNRDLQSVRYQPPGCVLINSPVETPTLAAAVRKDWGRLTVADHQRSLIGDAFSGRDKPAALARLRFFYPDVHAACVTEAHALAALAASPECGLALSARAMGHSQGMLVTKRFSGTLREHRPHLWRFAKLYEFSD